MNYYIGIDIGGTNIKAAVINEKNKILAFKSMPVASKMTCNIAAELVYDIMNEAFIASTDIRSLGVGIPGIIGSIKGPVLYTPNTDLSGVDVLDEINFSLQNRGINLNNNTFHMANDADCAGLAEAVCGAGQDFENVLLISLGTGVGGTFISHGKPAFFGKYGGEFGHFHFSDDGPMCRCGIKGCFEQYANSAAFQRLGFEKYTDVLAVGLAGYVNIFRPDVIILSGGVINEGQRLFDALNEKMRPLVYANELTGVPKILPAKLGPEAGAFGAALFGKIQ